MIGIPELAPWRIPCSQQTLNPISMSLSKERVTILTTSKGAENVSLSGPRSRTWGWAKAPQHMGLIRAAFLRLGHSFCLPIQFGEALFAGPLMTLNHSGMMRNFCLCCFISEDFMVWMSAKCPIVVTVILTSIHLEQTMLFASKAKHTLSCHPASNLLFIVVEIVMCTTDYRLCASVTVSLSSST